MPYNFIYPFSRNSLPKILEGIWSKIFTIVGPLKIRAWKTSEPVSFKKRRSGLKMELAVGQEWGKLWDCAWFNFTGVIPTSVDIANIVLLIDLNGEACVFDNFGTPFCGLTSLNSSFDFMKPGKYVVQLKKQLITGQKIDIWVDVGCNDLFGKLPESGKIKQADIAICNEQIKMLYYDYEVLHELLQQLDENSVRHHRILYALNNASHCLHDYTEAEVSKARGILSPHLKLTNKHSLLKISAIGHAHIDLAWLWPIRETIRKGARTFSTVLMMMDRYPDYKFGASQPQLYQWMKDYYPNLYKNIKKRIAQKRWEAQGCMWVESDINIPSGESLIRQILYGKAFFKKEFDIEIDHLWLPDVFGYSGSLPQILKKSGINYFLTQKLSWNLINDYPHHTFFWIGIDGSKILTHLPPEDTYNSFAGPAAALKIEHEYHDKAVSENCMMLFGIGDGGGGPGEEHLERLKRITDMHPIPLVRQEFSTDFFKNLEKNQDKYRYWRDELYLERHRGTYTTQARNKRFNRKLEIALRELEFSAMMAFVLTDLKYPATELETIWKEILLYQFHDLLPGTSIKRVYDESLAGYERIEKQVANLTQNSDLAISKIIKKDNVKNSAIILNSLSWQRRQWLNIGSRWYYADIPPMGYSVMDLSTFEQSPKKLRATKNILENNLIKINFDKNGFISSIYDKQEKRYVNSPGSKSNEICVYADRGDAWNFSPDYSQDKLGIFEIVSTKAAVKGPWACVTQIRQFRNSKMEQKIILIDDSKKVDFVTHVDWKDNEKLLRTYFPLNIFSSDVRCEIQFGNIKRPTCQNNPWDFAKYEICAHKWIDISQPDYGVALLNDCKYGHSAIENVLGITLLRSPIYPDPTADIAEHDFTYSLLPHVGDYIKGNVVQKAYELNIPLRILNHLSSTKNRLSTKGSFLSVTAPNIIIESIKKAEADDSMVVRLYESYGMNTNVNLKLGFVAKSVKLVDLMENPLSEPLITTSDIELQFRPFDIQTLKITPANNASFAESSAC